MSRPRRDSHHSLLHLDPTPMSGFSPAPSPTHDVERGFSRSSDGAEKGASVRGGSAMSPGLSGGGRGAIFYLSRLQRYSSYAMSIFASLHIANVSIIPAVTRSVPGSETYLLMTREIYQTPLAEPLLVALPVAAHIGSGIALRIARRIQNGRKYGAALPGFFAWNRWSTAEGRSIRVWPRVSYVSLSGYAFSLFLGAHVFTNRVLPLAFDGGSSNIGLGYVSHGFARHPWIAWTAYGGLVVLGGGHMVWGMWKWLGIAPSADEKDVLDKETRSRRRRRWWALQAAVVVTVAAWAVGGFGVVAREGEADGWIGQLYDHLFAQVGL